MSWRDDVREAMDDLARLRLDLLRVARPKHAHDVEDVMRRLAHALRQRTGETPLATEHGSAKP